MDLSTPNQPPGTFDTPPPATPAPEPAKAVSGDPLDALLKQIIGGWFILTDGQGAVSKWSEPAELLFGKEAPDALGHLFFDGLLTGELSDDAEQWRRFLAAGDPPHARALVEVTARHAPTDQAFALEAVFVPVKLDEGFDFSLFLEDLSFELPMNLMLLRMRQQHPVVVRALRAALDEEPQAWDGWRTAGTMVAFRPLAPTPWVETELAKREEDRSRADAEREEAIANPDPGVHGGSIDDLDDAAAVVARLLTALERIDGLERVAGRLPGQVEEARREAQASRVRAEAAEREAKHARAELERLEAVPGGGIDSELLARLERMEAGGHDADLAARVERLEQERLAAAAGAEARLTAALTEADAARLDLERRLGELESVAGLDDELERLRAEQARDAEARQDELERLRGDAEARQDELRATLERLERERAESDAARDELRAALERVEREHDRELEAARGELAAALERIDAVHRDAERLRERVGEVTVERHEGQALAGDDRRRLEELQREAEQARARLDALRTLADELREDSVRSAETTNALRAELDTVRDGEAEARAAVATLRAELHAVRGEAERVDLTDGNAGVQRRLDSIEAGESSARQEMAVIRQRLDILAGADATPWRDELAAVRDELAAAREAGSNPALDDLRRTVAALREQDSGPQLEELRRELDALREQDSGPQLEELRRELDALREQDPGPQLEGLRRELDALREQDSGPQLEELRRELDALRERGSDASVEELRRELDALREQPGTAVDELHREFEHLRERTVARSEFDDLHRAFDALRDGGVGRTDLEAIRQQLATLADGWAAKSDLDGVRAALDALGERVPTRDELADRVDRLAPRDAVDALRARLDEVASRDEIAALRERLEGLASRDEVTGLRERLDGLAPRDDVAALRERLDAMPPGGEIEALRGRLEGLAARDEVAALRERLDGVASRDEVAALRERLDALPPGGEIAALRERLDGLVSAEDLDGRLDGFATGADLRALRDELPARAETEQLDRLGADAEALRATVDGLGRRLDAAREEAAAARAQAEASAADAEQARKAAREATDRIVDVDRGAGSVLAEVKATGDRLEEVAGLARAAHDAAGAARGDQDEFRAAVARLGGEVQVAREQLQQAADEALGARQQAATAGEAATAAREDAGRAREDAQLLRRELSAGRERLESASADIARLGRELETVKEHAVGTLEGGVERLAEQVAAGRADGEARASEVLAELAAVREIAEQASSGVGELRAELAAMREETAAVRVQAELANAVAEKAHATAETAKVEDERLEALQAEVQFAISTMEEMKAGLTSAGQAALVARREAEQAKKAAEHAGDGTGEHVTAVFREILGLAAKGRPRMHQKGAGDAPPEPREPRHGFDDETVPMAVIGIDGKFKELNPSFCRLVGYQEHEFAKAAWPSPHDRQLYGQQQEQFSELVSGALEAVPVQSTYMHGQGLMVPVVGEITAVKGEDGLTSHLLLRAEERERAL
jgi:chromosome segregation ATPase